jgi:hypothetical protein
MFKAELEPFETSPDHYYLRINGKVVAAVMPSDFLRMLDSLGKAVSPAGHQHTAHAVTEYYNEKRRKKL